MEGKDENKEVGTAVPEAKEKKVVPNKAKTVTPEAEEPITKKTTPAEAKRAAREGGRMAFLRELLKDYAARYPENRVFHVTADNMVFLEKDIHLAKRHQRTLKEGNLESITINR